MLDHTIPAWAESDAEYFITVCCRDRGKKHIGLFPHRKNHLQRGPSLRTTQTLDRDFACGNRRVGTTLNLMVKYLPAASLDAIFAALSDPTRRRILDLLTRAELCVTDLAKPFSISLPAISKHLRVLEKAGLIKRERDGRVHRLRLEAKPMRDAAAWIERYRGFWEGQFDALADYLERPQTKGRL
jgi:DNA-binding transcriptional ArsR family regulator